jgi:hypothetical protein
MRVASFTHDGTDWRYEDAYVELDGGREVLKGERVVIDGQDRTDLMASLAEESGSVDGVYLDRPGLEVTWTDE